MQKEKAEEHHLDALSMRSSDISTLGLSDVEGGKLSPRSKSWAGLKSKTSRIMGLVNARNSKERRDNENEEGQG